MMKIKCNELSEREVLEKVANKHNLYCGNVSVEKNKVNWVYKFYFGMGVRKLASYNVKTDVITIY